MAILACLSQLTLLPPMENSSYFQILYLHFGHSLTSIMPIHLFKEFTSRYFHLTPLTLKWVPGHVSLPEHDAVDQTAKQVTSLRKITDNYEVPATDYKNYYRILVLKS